MCENEKLIEQTGRKRLEFGAVPLSPWSAAYPGLPGESYSQASLRHIHERLDANIHIPIENGTIGSNEELQAIHSFCDISLADAHMRRITHHFENSSGKEIQGYPEVVKAAQEGTATPADMLEVLVINPHMGAIELAKLSHPFDSFGDKAMMESVYEALEELGGAVSPGEGVRHKVKRLDMELPALTVLEKQHLATIANGRYAIDVIMRKSLLVRGNAGAMAQDGLPRIDRLIKNITKPEAKEQLFGHISNASHTSESLDATSWLDILTTSVYAHYRKAN